MSTLGILQDLTIHNSITALSTVQTGDLVVTRSSSIPDVTSLKEASGGWDAAYTYVTTASSNPIFDTILASTSISTSGSFLSGSTNLWDVFEPRGGTKRFVADITGDGSQKLFTFDNTLSTQDVVANVLDIESGDIVFPSVTATSAQFAVEFNTPFTGTLYKFVAFGSISIEGGVTTPPVTSGPAPTYTQLVSSVAGRIGDVVLSAADITVPVVTETTSFTLSTRDLNSMVKINSSSAATVIIPADVTTPITIGTQVVVIQMGTGQVTVSAAPTVSVRSSGLKFKTSNQYAMASLVKVDTNEWVLGGDLTT